MNKKSYKKLEIKRKKKLASLLKYKRVIYCRTPETALRSIARIFDLDEQVCLQHLKSINSKTNPRHTLDKFMQKCQKRNLPIVDGAIYFHGSRTLRKNYFLSGLNALSHSERKNVICNILETDKLATKIYRENIELHPTTGCNDTGPCAVLRRNWFFESHNFGTEKHNYLNSPEAIPYRNIKVDENDYDHVMRVFYLRTVPKIVSFYVDNLKNPSNDLEVLISYAWKHYNQLSTYISAGSFDGGMDYNCRSIRHKNIIGTHQIKSINGEPYQRFYIKSTDPDIYTAEPHPSLSWIYNKN